MKIFMLTFGCKVNQYESEYIREMMSEKGYRPSDRIEDADVIIVNSCTVTAQSDHKIRQALHKVRRVNPQAVIALTGCMVQAFPEQSSKLLEADILIGNKDKKNIPLLVEEFLKNRRKIVNVNDYKNDDIFEKMGIYSFDGRTRAFLKIQDGCNRFCSYCIIPYARGRVRSKPLNDISNEVKTLALRGYKEIVLVGINLSAYGMDFGKTLYDAIETVNAVPGIERIRLGSLEPEQMDEFEVKRLSKLSKLCPQFHLSLQSGCDETLKRMNRHYNSEEYYKIVENIRKYFANPAITTDIMVGFTGETEEEFQKSLDFVKKVEFAKVHVFPYSVRPGTRAASFSNQVAKADKSKRSQHMIKVAGDLRSNFLNEQVGKTYKVLFETKAEDGMYEGYTTNYIPVKIKNCQDISGKILNVKITNAFLDYCVGELI